MQRLAREREQKEATPVEYPGKCSECRIGLLDPSRTLCGDCLTAMDHWLRYQYEIEGRRLAGAEGAEVAPPRKRAKNTRNGDT